MSTPIPDADTTFSPLFIGEVTVTTARDMLWQVNPVFQSPIHRGSNCNNIPNVYQDVFISAFSPLFIGEVTVTACR